MEGHGDVRWWVWRIFGWQPSVPSPPKPIDSIGADAPIKNASEDLLRRVPFAERIADVLASSNARDGRVFAIRGDWGMGKSSLKNLVVEALAVRKPPSEWLEFNPWQWGDSDVIARALFGQMASKLGGAYSSQAASRARAFRKYGSILAGSAGALREAGDARGLAEWFASIGLLAAGIGLAFPELPAAMIAAVLLVSAGIVKALGLVLGHLGRDRTLEPLDAVRKDLEKRLAKLEQPLIVFVDDIDRLESDQIRLLFRQIKVNANLPNIVFVLLFQTSMVVRALEPVAGGEGHKYLEKIVQAHFDLPVVPPERLHQIFAEQLDLLAGRLATPENGFEQVRWGNVLVGGMQAFIRNLRDTRRLLASISIHLPLHTGKNAFEVNIVDFFALETLRVFEPALHAAIAANKLLLLQTGNNGRREDKDGQAIKDLVGTVRHERRQACRYLLEELFPTAKWAFGGSAYGLDWIKTWMEAKRVCTMRCFDRYFELQLPEGALSESDYVDFVESAGDAADLNRRIHALQARGLLAALASRLDESVEQLPLENITILLPAIFDIGEMVFRRSLGPSNVAHISAWRAAIWFLRREPDPIRRSELFIEALRRSDGLAVPAVLISLDIDARKRGEPATELLLDGERLKDSQSLWVQKVEALAANDKVLLAMDGLVSYLLRWRDFSGDIAKPRDWVRSIAGQDEKLPGLLSRFASVVSSHRIGDHVSTRSEEFHRGNVEPFFDLSALGARLAGYDRSRLTGDQARTFERLEATVAEWLTRSDSESTSTNTHERNP